MTYALGSLTAFPHLSAAVAATPPDWLTAAAQCHIANATPARNAANHTLLVNAAVVDADGSDPDVLHWPTALDA